MNRTFLVFLSISSAVCLDEFILVLRDSAKEAPKQAQSIGGQDGEKSGTTFGVQIIKGNLFKTIDESPDPVTWEVNLNFPKRLERTEELFDAFMSNSEIKVAEGAGSPINMSGTFAGAVHLEGR